MNAHVCIYIPLIVLLPLLTSTTTTTVEVFEGALVCDRSEKDRNRTQERVS